MTECRVLCVRLGNLLGPLKGRLCLMHTAKLYVSALVIWFLSQTIGRPHCSCTTYKYFKFHDVLLVQHVSWCGPDNYHVYRQLIPTLTPSFLQEERVSADVPSRSCHLRAGQGQLEHFASMSIVPNLCPAFHEHKPFFVHVWC